MTSEELRKLIDKPEGLTLDFKRELKLDKEPPPGADKHRWKEFVEGQWAELVKDILSLANGNVGAASQGGMLIVGVADKPGTDGSRELYDTSALLLTGKQILQKVNNYCKPPIPDINLERLLIDGKSILVISVSPTPYLHETTRKLVPSTGTFDNFRQKAEPYQENTVFVRRGESIYPASQEERTALESEKRGASIARSAEKRRSSTLDNLLEEHSIFIGRQFVRDRIQLFLETQRNGLLLIKGEMGAGKTALMANLKTLYSNGVFFFYRGTSGVRSPDEFVRSVLEELRLKHKLPPQQKTSDPKELRRELQELLFEISNRLESGHKELIFVDALDEATRAFDGATAIEVLPWALPDNCYFIVTSNSQNPDLKQLAGRQNMDEFRLEPTSGENKADAYTYVDAVLDGYFDVNFRHWIADGVQWNFLILSSLCADIKENHLSAEQITDSFRHADPGDRVKSFFDAQWSRVERLFEWEPDALGKLENVIGAIATAGANVTRDQVCSAFGLNASTFDWCLKFIGKYLHVEVDDSDKLPLYSLNHWAWHVYFLSKFSPLHAYHQKWSALLSNWATLRGLDLKLALLSLHTHLIKINDLNALAKLAPMAGSGSRTPPRGDYFLDAISAHPHMGLLRALDTAEKIAIALAKDPAHRREELLSAAYWYCRIRERIRGDPAALPELVDRNEIEEVLYAVQAEGDKARSSVLALAVAILLKRRADIEEAQKRLEEASKLSETAHDFWEEGVETFDRLPSGELSNIFNQETILLLRALGGWLRQSRAIPESFDPSPRFGGLTSLQRLPNRYKLIVVILTATWIRWMLWCSSWLLVVVVVKGSIPQQNGPIAPYLATLIWLLIVMAIACGLVAMVVRAIRSPRISERLWIQLAAGLESATDEDRRRGLEDAVRYYALLPQSETGEVISWLVDRWLTKFEGQPQRLVKLFCDAACLPIPVFERFIRAAHNVEIGTLEKTYTALLQQEARIVDNGALLGIFAIAGNRFADSEALVHSLSLWRRGPMRGGENPVVRSLAQGDPAYLASTILATFVRHNSRDTSWLHPFLNWEMPPGILAFVRWLRLQVYEAVRLRIPGLTAPFPLGRRARILVNLPAYVAVASFYVLVLLELPLLLLLRQFGRLPAHIAFPAWVSEDIDFKERRDRLHHLVIRLDRTGRRLRRTLFVLDLQDRAPRLEFSSRFIAKVLPNLIHSGRLRSSADLVLSTMVDRTLLDAVRDSKWIASQREIKSWSDREQLESTLPVKSILTSFGATVGIPLGMIGIGIVLILLFARRAQQFQTSNSSASFGKYVLSELCGCVLWLATIQHVLPRLYRRKREKYEPIDTVLGIISGIGIVAIAVGTWTGSSTAVRGPAGGIGHPLLVQMLVVAGSLVLTNCITPEVISMWRGANLLYPSMIRLWVQRMVLLATLPVIGVGYFALMLALL